MLDDVIKLCYVYFSKKSVVLPDEKSLPHTKIITIGYEEEKEFKLPKASIYILEVDSLTKERLSIIRKMLHQVDDSTIFLCAENSLHKPILLKFALFMGAKDVLTSDIEEEKLKNILIKSILKLDDDVSLRKMISFSKEIYHSLIFCFFKNNELIFASDALMQFVGAKTLPEVKEKILTLQELEQKKSSKVFTCNLLNEKSENWNSFFSIFNVNDKVVVTFSPFERIGESNIKLNHRFASVEWLKDRLVEKASSKTSLIIVTFQIENKESLLNSFSYLEYYEYIKKCLHDLSAMIPYKSHLSQWSDNSYTVGYVGEESENVKEQISIFLEKISLSNAAVKPIIGASMWEIENQTLSEVVTLLDTITKNKLTADDVKSMKYYTFTQQNFDSDEEEIIYLLQHSMFNKVPLKLLNIYKGLCIYTNSEVLKIKGKDVFVKSEISQAYAMEQSKKVTIHSPMFAKEISANVSFVNFKEGVSVVNGFKYLETSANNRQFTRVQPHTRTFVFFKNKTHSYQGTILDISLKALALECRHNMIHIPRGSKVNINFRIPDAADNNSSVEMNGIAKVTVNTPMDSGMTKIVLMLEFEEIYENYLIRYMYERQKELIAELKSLVKNK